MIPSNTNTLDLELVSRFLAGEDAQVFVDGGAANSPLRDRAFDTQPKPQRSILVDCWPKGSVELDDDLCA
jgi:hypothetical protein